MIVDLLYQFLLVINVLVFFYFLFVNGSYITLIFFSYVQVKASRGKQDIYKLSGLFDTALYRQYTRCGIQ